MNTSSGRIDLAPVKLRYWFTKDAPAGTVVNSYCDYAWLDCNPSTGKVTHGIMSVTPARPGGDTYLEIGFRSGAALAAGASTNDIQMRLQKADYSVFDETNDHSYGPYSELFQSWSKVTVYYAGTRVWGTEP